MSNTSCDNLDETQVPAKKLKQARLVFKPLTPPAKKDNSTNAQKRKFNELENDVEIIEDPNKDESKENKNVSGCLENGSVEPKETALKKKKISSSDDELNVTKEEKSVKDVSLEEKENTAKDSKDNRVNEKEEKSVKDVCSIEKEKVNEDTGLKNNKVSATKEENEDVNLGEQEKVAEGKHLKGSKNLEEKKKSSEEAANKEESPEKEAAVEETKEPVKGSEADVEKKKEDEETESKEEDIVLIDLDEKSSESAKEPSVIGHQEESNEEDKKSKDGSVTSGTSEDALNVSSVSAKEPPATSAITPSSERKITKPRKLTPKQLEKQRERERIRSEKEKKKAEELEMKLKLKREKEELKRREQEEKEKIKREKEELKQKELEEKKKLEDLKKKEKEEKEKRRLAEIEQKNEERLRKEEEKRKMEEEKKKQDELKQQKENKVKAAFASFFVNKPKSKQAAKTESSEAVAMPTSLAFMPFQEKPCMKLAPVTRVTLSPEQVTTLENAIANPLDSDVKELYLDQLKSGNYQKGTSGKTWPYEEEDDEPMIVEADGEAEEEMNIDSKRKLMRVKLLQFHENHRPPYYGTWRKKSKTVKPRNPCAKDDVHFDYEVDSDDEWEEGEGESLRGSDDEKESEDDYEVDNETFVPHGYLSDEEAQEEEDAEVMNPEDQKLKLKLLGEEFEAELNEKTQRLKPVLVGPMWINNNVEETTCVDSRIVKYLMPRRAVWKEECSPISTTDPVFGADENSPDNANNPASTTKSRKFTDEEIKSLIRLVHGSVRNRMFLAKEFLSILESQSSTASQTSIRAKIKEIATYKLCPSNEGSKMIGRKCWFVTPEIRAQYGLSDLLASDNPHCSSIPDPSPAPIVDSTAPCITKFTKVLSEEDRLKQLTEMSIDHPKPPTAALPQVTTPASASLITKYTKVLSEEECLKQLTSPVSDKTPKPCDKASKSPSIVNFLKTPKANSPCTTATSSPVSSTASQSVRKEKKRLPLLASVKVGEEIPAAVRPSCAVKPAENIAQPVTTMPSASNQKSTEKTASTHPEPMEVDSPSEAQYSPNLSNSSAKAKKRVPLLVSVKRGEQIPLSSRPSVAQSLSLNKSEVKEDSTAKQTQNIENTTKPPVLNAKSGSAGDIECVQLDSD